MKEHINKIILVVIITLSVAATLLYANPVDVATDSGFDTSYDGGSGGYSGGGSSWSSSGDSSGLSNNDLEEWKKLSTPENTHATLAAYHYRHFDNIFWDIS